jgi:hypothetical protein
MPTRELVAGAAWVIRTQGSWTASGQGCLGDRLSNGRPVLPLHAFFSSISSPGWNFPVSGIPSPYDQNSLPIIIS